MTIGALNGLEFQPYIYNTNAVSSASMNKLARISDNLSERKTDYSGLVSDESKNINPLHKGQTLDFQGMLQMQMQRGRANAARMMKPAQENGETAEAVEQDFAATVQLHEADARASDTVENAVQTGQADNGSMGAGGYSSFQMQQAISAYEMSMTA